MEIKNFNIDGKEIIFVNDSHNTRYGFKHTSHLFIDGIEKGDNTSNYINRTWECYRYQSCMLGLVNKLIEKRIDKLKDIFKNENEYKILNAKRREEFDKYLSSDNLYIFYKQIYDTL